MMLDDRGVHALGKVSEPRKLAELARADVLCAPSLRGESFGMVLTEAFAAGTPVLASDIPGYRDVLRDGIDGQLVPAGDPLALAEALRPLALEASAARGWPSPRASAPSASPGRTWPPRCSTATSRRSPSASPPRAWPAPLCATASRPPTCCRASPPSGCRPALPPRTPPRSPRPRSSASSLLLRRRPGARVGAATRVSTGSRRARALRRLGLATSSLRGAGLAALALAAHRRRPRRRLAAGLQARPARRRPRPLMCAAMFVRALAWHAILAAAPTWRRAKRRDAMQGTFIGVLMSCHAARAPGRALACADRRPPPRARARDAAGGARHDGLADAAQPARAGDPRRCHALQRQRPRRSRPGAARGRARAAGGACRGAARARR